ncbi:MAG: pyrimidine reductase family protein [Thermoleophilaceae bacterium]
MLSMVSTVDGQATIGGRSGPIGGPSDREMFHGLRTQGDAVMVGAGTARTERYGRIVRDRARRDRRTREGLAADPVAVIVSASMDLPPDLPLLADPSSQVVFLTAPDAPELPRSRAQVDYLRSADTGSGLVLAPLLERLRAEHGVRSIVCEGGPRLNRSLLAEELVDELFVTVAPKLAGGEGPTIVAGPALADPPQLEIVSLLECDGTLFLRQRVIR